MIRYSPLRRCCRYIRKRHLRQEKVKARTLRRLRKQAAAHAIEVDKLLTRWHKRRRLLERADELGLPRRPGADEELSDEWEEELADAVIDDVPPTASKDRTEPGRVHLAVRPMAWH